MFVFLDKKIFFYIGMERRDHVPIRIEPGLFECPHYNHKIVDSFMTKKELMDNRYNIKREYRPIIPKVIVPETLDDYFERSANVIRGIIDRYGHYGGTVLIVTHAPGLLALPDAIKGLKPKIETFYRDVSIFPPLAAYIAEYDGSKWRYSDQPFNFVPPGQ
jgi:broad specificity phosphatase PhoE